LQDRRGGLTLDAVRRLAPAVLVVVLALLAVPSAWGADSISGSVRDDPNGNGAADPGEGTVGGVTVGFDTNGDQALDVTTNSADDGTYRFSGVPPGRYKVTLVVPDGYDNTGPGAIEIDVASGQDAVLPPFFIRQSGSDLTVDLIAGDDNKPTGGDDLLTGTDKADTIFGLGGNDVLLGLAGNDVLDGGNGDDDLSGGPGKDRLKGQKGNDSLTGGAGDDVLIGGPGKDKLSGGKGNDTLVGNGGKDALAGGPGNDTINSRDGVSELVKCGPGRDRVKADKTDRLSSCETKLR
jgi:hypothetical protein